MNSPSPVPSKAPIGTLRALWPFIQPVSYTHLDVYKRQELTLEEIGTITGAGRETVKSRLRYAMDKLRARLTS